jgi:hypothetical protein
VYGFSVHMLWTNSGSSYTQHAGKSLAQGTELLTNPGTLVRSCCLNVPMSCDRQFKVRGSVTSLEPNFSTVLSYLC